MLKTFLLYLYFDKKKCKKLSIISNWGGFGGFWPIYGILDHLKKNGYSLSPYLDFGIKIIEIGKKKKKSKK